MTFLDDLERELREAHPRRTRAKRRATIERGVRAAPATIGAVALVGGAAAFVTTVGGEESGTMAGGTGPSPPAATPTSPPPQRLAPGYVPVPGGAAVLNATDNPGHGRLVAEFLSPRHRIGQVGDSPFQNRVEHTTVYYAPGHKRDAVRWALELDVAYAVMTEPIEVAAGDVPLAIEVGPDLVGGGTTPLRAPGTKPRVGSITTLEFRDQTLVEITANRRTDPALGVFLTGGAPTRFLGFIARPVRGPQHVQAVAKLPRGTWRRIVLSKEAVTRGGELTKPSQPVLEGPLP